MTDHAAIGPGDIPATPAPGQADRPIPLPPLREDLLLLEGPRSFDGAPSWTIHDPARNRYFRIGHAAFQLLSRWPLGEGRRVLAEVNSHTTLAAAEADLVRLLQFLEANELLAATSPQAARKLAANLARRQRHWLTWLVHNYLFFRIPLVRPDGALKAALPLARPFFTRAFVLATVFAGLAGLLLALRQWDSFVHTFLHFLSWEGAVYYGLALMVAKLLHELGHAFAAKRAGCRVPTMGVAFLVMWPVLYTDVTDAWRLRSRRARLHIGAAGMLTEVMLAAWATLAWSFLPDGPVRSACFLLATITWVLTIAINLNPFLRFDGYYLLSDLLGVQNLQERGFALARWRMREALFGLGLPPPERFDPRLARRLLIYAYATWIWRFFLFLAIALLVYHLFFKLLGLILMAVELAWFLARPAAREIAAWWTLRGKMRANRNLAVTLLALGGIAALLAVPWQGEVSAPVLIEASQSIAVQPQGPARLVEVLAEEGRQVRAGEALFRLDNPHLAQQLRESELQVESLQHEVLRRSASREAGAETGVLEQRLAEALARLRGLRAEAEKLVLAAPIDGRLVDVPDHLAPGRWLTRGESLGRIVADGPPRLTAYVTASELARLQAGAEARIVADSLDRASFPARLATADVIAVETLDSPYLASDYGGPIPTRIDQRGRLVPVESVYRVQLTAGPEATPPERILTGVALIEAETESLLASAWRTASAVLVREAGF